VQLKAKTPHEVAAAADDTIFIDNDGQLRVTEPVPGPVPKE
jgi:hypothetical protein